MRVRWSGRAWAWMAAMAIAGLASLLPARSPAAELETPRPRQFSVLDGLPSNRIYGLAEDRQGYLWVATRDGLARYDGVGFRIWRVGTGLRDNFVWAVHVDAQDRVWIGTEHAGLSMLDAQRRTFRHFDRRSHPQLGNAAVWSIESTADGAVWFGTSGDGLFRLDRSGRLDRYRNDPRDAASLPSDAVTALRRDRRGDLWVATEAGAARWNGRGFERVRIPGGQGRVDSLVADDEGRVWIGLPGVGWVREPDGDVHRLAYRDPALGGVALQVLLQDRQGAHWLDTRSGLARERRGEVRDVPLYSNTSRGTVRPFWSTAYEDREGGLWFASADSGLWHLPANWRDFSLLTRRVEDPATPANAFVYGVAPSSSNGLWLVGSGGVLDLLDPHTGRIDHVLAGVCGNTPGEGVLEASDGGVWIGCRGELVRFDPRTRQVRRWSHGAGADRAPEAVVRRMAALGDGTLWFADLSTVQARGVDGRVTEQVRVGDGRGLSAGTAIRQLAAAPDGGLWLAGSHGLSMWNAGQRRFEPVPGAPREGIGGFTVDGGGQVWIAGMGTLSAWRWDGARLSRLRTVGVREGIPLVMPGGILADGDGTLWLTTLRGLVRYDPKRDRVRVYGVRDGLPSQEFSDNPMRISPLGYVAVGTADGLLLFHPRQVQWSDRVPTLAISSIGVRRDERRVELARTGRRVELQPGDRDLRIVARLLSFTDAHAHRYRFRLDGYDRDWVQAGASGERLFASLAPGRYRLQVQARTVNGDWSPPQSLDLSMPPPWWRTAWAYALFALAGLSLLAGAAYAYRLRLKRRHAWQLARQKQALAEQASEAKTRFLATLGHEVRTPMTGVLGMSELLLGSDLDIRQRGHVEAIRRAGEHLLRLVNDALDLARIEAGRLQLDEAAFPLRALLDEVAGLMAPLAERKGLRFEREVEPGAPYALRGDRTRVMQILMNLLGNAIKFTGQGFVSLAAMPLPGGGVRFVVGDSGPGLNEEQRERVFQRFEQAEGARTAARYGGSGLGLAISQELAAAMRGRIDVHSSPGQGTRFVVDLPLQALDGERVDAPAAPAEVPRASPRALRLLLVEDDATVAEVLTGLLQAQGHAVTHVAHGLAALAEVANGRFDLALLDLDLPGIDGLALARQLRAQGFAAPLLAVTARADAGAEPAALDAGFDGFLRKPLTGELLARAIERVHAGASGLAGQGSAT